MNQRQRKNNRRNAEHLAYLAKKKRLEAHTCENCGRPGGHWVAFAMTLQDIMDGKDPPEAWLCQHRNQLATPGAEGA